MLCLALATLRDLPEKEKTMKGQRNCTSRRIPPPSSEQISLLMSALGLNARVVGSTFGVPAFIVERWMTGSEIPDAESSSKLWKLYNLFYVQTNLPGFLYIKVVPPKA